MFCLAVGLKLNLLDVTLSIDLQYLGVCLPIPPPIPSPQEILGTSSQGEQNKTLNNDINATRFFKVIYELKFCSCTKGHYFLFPVHFISRTGKTTDITKIKGWREKFSTTSSSTVPGGTLLCCG